MDISFKQVGFSYQKGTPFEQRALYGIDFTIPEHSYTAIIGHTGSGKSTILQHLNALLVPTEGIVQLGEREILPDSHPQKLKPLRKKVGIAFQFPEAQLFEETVLKDVAFGPQNFGIGKEEAELLAREALKMVGLDEGVFEQSPFDLSGGQMRRVAIAGVLAMEPEVLVLDEPTAGLDPAGRREMMQLFKRLHQKGLTIVLVTHQMDDVADFADFVIVMEHGTVVKKGTPREIFLDVNWLQEKQLDLPSAFAFYQELVAKGWQAQEIPLTLNQLVDTITFQEEENRG